MNYTNIFKQRGLFDTSADLSSPLDRDKIAKIWIKVAISAHL
jgi:hypothetical protein